MFEEFVACRAFTAPPFFFFLFFLMCEVGNFKVFELTLTKSLSEVLKSASPGCWIETKYERINFLHVTGNMCELCPSPLLELAVCFTVGFPLCFYTTVRRKTQEHFCLRFRFVVNYTQSRTSTEEIKKKKKESVEKFSVQQQEILLL